MLCEAGPAIATIGFKRGKEFVSVPLQTDRFKGLSLYVIQTVKAQRIDKGSNKGRHLLRTIHYSYRIEEDEQGGAREPLMRWEYKIADPAIAGPPRHHAHLAHRNARKGDLDYDKLHIPAWVTIEEVVRFVIHELGHSSPCGDSWPLVLAESESHFYEKLSSKGCPRAGSGERPL